MAKRIEVNGGCRRCIGQRVRGFDIRPRGRLQVRGRGRDTPRQSKTKEELETLEKVAVTVTEIACLPLPCHTGEYRRVCLDFSYCRAAAADGRTDGQTPHLHKYTYLHKF
ncbi:hypothetical protein TcasGA2_TC002619 [Tribolium castaneum]|uniref:Uncharacterized protein n=1 Tax=Tribolium castaneum TaxID=7070 RepID=D6WF59_TRICA|nr:hypothetical protein TcasGA2_TC002619 [Tribolium castaneum]